MIDKHKGSSLDDVLEEEGRHDETKAIASKRELAFHMSQSASNNETLRPSGLCAGEFIVPEDFDAPLPDDVIDQFKGSD